MTACPEPKGLTRRLKDLHAKTAPVARNFAENYLAMQTTDAARRAASRAVHSMGSREQRFRDAEHELAPRRAMWDNFPDQHAWEYSKALEHHGTEDMIDRAIAQGKSRAAAETEAKTDFASIMDAKLKELNPRADPTHVKAEAEFMANEMMLHKNLMKDTFERDKQFGSEADYRKDYFPHIYKNFKQALEWFDKNIKNLGATWYQKERTFDYLEQAKKAGIELKYTNPIDVILHRLKASIASDEAVKMLRRMQLDGDAVPTSEAKGIQKGWTNKDGQPYKFYAADRQQWNIRPEAYNIVKNVFDHESLSSTGGAIGTAYDAMRQVKNVLMPINLGLTSFHYMHEIGFIGPAQALKRALQLSMKNGDWLGEYIKAGKLILSEPIFHWPLDKIPLIGKTLDEAAGHRFSDNLSRTVDRWQKMSPEDRAKDPIASAYVQFFEEGGFGFTRPERESSRYLEAFKQARKDKSLSMLPKGAMAVLEGIQKPLFNYVIPGMKKTQAMHEIAALQSLHPEEFQNNNWRRHALQQIARNLDDRFGEMNYNNLIMNKIAKDVAVISMVSPSWNYGFARQMAGGAANVARQGLGRGTELQKQLMNTDDKAMFIAHYAGLTAGIGGMMTYLLTGNAPEGVDYLYPRTGLTNSDGTPGRLNLPSNFRDIPMLVGHTQQHNSVISGASQLLWSKTILQPYLSAITGEDWKGGDMYDTNRPWIIRNLQLADSLLGETFKPAGFEAASRAGDVPGAGTREKVLAHAGFGPAPKYVGHDALENRILQLSYERRGPTAYQYGEKTGLGRGLVQGAIRTVAGDQLKSEVRHEAGVEKTQAQAQGNAQKVYEANKKLAEQGQVSKGALKYGNPKQQVEQAFARLPIEDQQGLVKGMSSAQFNRFVTANPAFGDRRLKANQQRLIKDRTLPSR